jgi:Uma2 family endonuclease
MRTRDEIDLSVDPPPELVVEIEITKSAIAKLEVFAMMGVPEVWRHDGASLRMFRLNNGDYSAISESVALPGFPAGLAESLLAERFNQGVMALIRQFRKSLA